MSVGRAYVGSSVLPAGAKSMINGTGGLSEQADRICDPRYPQAGRASERRRRRLQVSPFVCSLARLPWRHRRGRRDSCDLLSPSGESLVRPDQPAHLFARSQQRRQHQSSAHSIERRQCNECENSQLCPDNFIGRRQVERSSCISCDRADLLSARDPPLVAASVARRPVSPSNCKPVKQPQARPLRPEVCQPIRSHQQVI